MPCSGIGTIEVLHEQLRRLWINLPELELDGTALVKVLVQITEALVSGEAEHHNFRLARECGLLSDFAGILNAGDHVPQAVKVQLLQTFMILVQNARTKDAMEHLFGDHSVNRIIMTPLDWQNEEIIAYYICFLKSIAMRLEKWSMPHFYFIENQCVGFPLYTEAVRFFCHRDHMVRAAVRTLTLNIYSVSDERLRHFIVEHSSHTYFIHLACHLSELWVRFDRLVKSTRKNASSTRMLLDINEQHKDLLIYISDVMELGAREITHAIAEQLLRYCFFPVLLRSLTQRYEPTNLAEQLLRDTSVTDSNADSRMQLLAPEVSLFLFQQVLSIFRDKAVLEPIFAILFLQNAPRDLLSCCTSSAPPFPTTYRSTHGFLCGPGAQVFTYGPRCRSKRVHPKRYGDSLFLDIGNCTQTGENHLRQQFLLGLSNRWYVHVLLTAGVLHTSITRHSEILQVLLERFRISPFQDTHISHRIRRTPSGHARESILCSDEVETMQEAFDQLDIFLDNAIDATVDLCGSPYVLTEVQNLPVLSTAACKYGLSTKSVGENLPRPAIAAAEFHTNDTTKLFISGDTTQAIGQADLSEVLLCASKALEQSTNLHEVVLRTLAALILELAHSAHAFQTNSSLRRALSIVEHFMAWDWQSADRKCLSEMEASEGSPNSSLDVSSICSDVHWLLASSEAVKSACIDTLADDRSKPAGVQKMPCIVRPVREELAKHVRLTNVNDSENIVADTPPSLLTL